MFYLKILISEWNAISSINTAHSSTITLNENAGVYQVNYPCDNHLHYILSEYYDQ